MGIDSCVFCRIVKGEIPCSKVYEDGFTLAFLDIAPVNKGHTLVITKGHFENIHDISDELLMKQAKVVKLVADAVKAGTDCDGISIAQSNGKAAGQVVPHIHFHVMPRFSDDGLRHWPQMKYDAGEMDEFCERIAQRLKRQ